MILLMIMKKTSEYVPAVEKALDILEYIAASGRGQTILGLAKILHIPQASAFRLVNTLINRGYLRKKADGALVTGPRSALLARRALDAGGVRQAAHPFASLLREATGKTVEVTAFENDEITFVDILESPEPIRYIRTLGTPLIGSTNPVTLVVLAYVDPKKRSRILTRMADIRRSYLPLRPELSDFLFKKVWDPKKLDTIRRQGYAADYGEQTPAVTRITAPLLNSEGQVVGTLGIAGPHFQMTPEISKDWISRVLEAAERFRTEAGHLAPLADAPAAEL